MVMMLGLHDRTGVASPLNLLGLDLISKVCGCHLDLQRIRIDGFVGPNGDDSKVTAAMKMLAWYRELPGGNPIKQHMGDAGQRLLERAGGIKTKAGGKFATADYAAAAGLYAHALATLGDEPTEANISMRVVLHSNLAEANLRQEKWHVAAKHAQQALQIDSSHAKSLRRLEKAEKQIAEQGVMGRVILEILGHPMEDHQPDGSWQPDYRYDNDCSNDDPPWSPNDAIDFTAPLEVVVKQMLMKLEVQRAAKAGDPEAQDDNDTFESDVNDMTTDEVDVVFMGKVPQEQKAATREVIRILHIQDGATAAAESNHDSVDDEADADTVATTIERLANEELEGAREDEAKAGTVAETRHAQRLQRSIRLKMRLHLERLTQLQAESPRAEEGDHEEEEEEEEDGGEVFRSDDASGSDDESGGSGNDDHHAETSSSDDDYDDGNEASVLDDPVAQAERLRQSRELRLTMTEALRLPQRDAARREQELAAKKEHDKKLLRLHDKQLLSRRLIRSAAAGDKKQCSQYLDQGADINFVQTADDPENAATKTALSEAVWQGLEQVDRGSKADFFEMQQTPEIAKYTQVVELLLERAADPNLRVNSDCKSSGGTAPLIFTAERGNVQMMTLLLEHGADPDIANHADATAFHLACVMCKPSCVKTLVHVRTAIRNCSFVLDFL
jgi:hypothetical protein